jgi:hypothetical protein
LTADSAQSADCSPNRKYIGRGEGYSLFSVVFSGSPPFLAGYIGGFFLLHREKKY